MVVLWQKSNRSVLLECILEATRGEKKNKKKSSMSLIKKDEYVCLNEDASKVKGLFILSRFYKIIWTAATCSCSASTQTAVYETMQSAGGTSKKAYSIERAGGGAALLERNYYGSSTS